MKDFIVKSTTQSRNPETLVWNWKLKNNIDGYVTINNTNSVGLGTSILKILQGTFKEEHTYTFELQVIDQNGEGANTYTIPINDLPKNGLVDISPRKGYGYITKWQMITSSWVDSDTPLKYRFGYWNSLNDIGNMEMLTYASSWGLNRDTSKILANPTSSDEQIYVTVIAEDSYGAQALAENYIQCHVVPVYFDQIDSIVNLKDELFKDLSASNPNDLLEGGRLVQSALGEFTKRTGGARILQQNADAQSKTQGLVTFFSSSKNEQKG